MADLSMGSERPGNCAVVRQMSVPHSGIRTDRTQECHTPRMYSASSEGGSGHERAHDPCRADWQEVTAEHPSWSHRTALRVALATVLLVAAAGTLWGAFAVVR
jgi:hypothetical protein